MTAATVERPRRADGTMLALPDDIYWEHVGARLLGGSKRAPSGCLLWMGKVTYSGYGHISIRNRQENAHRAAYRAWLGEIPAGLEIDHLCRVRNCIEPSHLEAVTHAENLRRIHAHKAHCVNGHDRAEHSYLRGDGRRICRACRRASKRKARKS